MNQLSLDKLNITSLNEIQLAASEIIAQKRDLILTAPTGSGKTLAFLLPLFERLAQKEKNIQALILVPTRELALQIEQVFRKLTTGFKVNCCYGGHAVRTEKNNFSNPPALLIGTPGRIAFHLERRNFDPSAIKFLVLDEFDKSLEFGFEEDMAYIISKLGALEQQILTSATKMQKLPGFIKMPNPASLDFSATEEFIPELNVYKLSLNTISKEDLLIKLLCHKADKPTLVFCNERETIYNLSDLLYEVNIDHEIFHGKMEQPEREKSLFKFKNGTVNILITTDLASRGLDIPEIENIIHYQLPHTKSIFVHRNGRTARMHADGNIFVFSSRSDEKDYLPDDAKEFILPNEVKSLKSGNWQTLYLSLGKKDKINKIDIVGVFLQLGQLEKADLGLIEVKDKASYVALNKEKVQTTLSLLNGKKIKGKKLKIELAS